MSLIVKDYRCERCNEDHADVMHERGEQQSCESCGDDFVWIPSPTRSPEWGQSRYVKSLDMEFSSRSELNSYLKQNGLEQAPSADREGGSRNEGHLNLGKIYSYGS